MVVDLKIVVPLRVVMTLSTLHISTEEDPSDIPCDDMCITTAVEKETLLRTLRAVPPRTADDLSQQLI